MTVHITKSKMSGLLSADSRVVRCECDSPMVI